MGRFVKPYFGLSMYNLINYFAILTVPFHDINALYGFFLILVVVSQLASGTMLSFSLITEPMIVPIVRDEEDLEDLYADDFFLSTWKRSRLIIYFWVNTPI